MLFCHGHPYRKGLCVWQIYNVWIPGTVGLYCFIIQYIAAVYNTNLSMYWYKFSGIVSEVQNKSSNIVAVCIQKWCCGLYSKSLSRSVSIGCVLPSWSQDDSLAFSQNLGDLCLYLGILDLKLRKFYLYGREKPLVTCGLAPLSHAVLTLTKCEDSKMT